MSRKMSLSVCLLCFAVASMIGCSFLHTSKPAKAPETVKKDQGSTIEWGERKWEYYEKDNGGVSYYFDKGSVTFPSKNVIHVWRRRVFPEVGARHISSNMKEITAIDEFDCSESRYRSLEVQGLKWDGTTTDVFRRPAPWGMVYEGTAEDYFLTNYCGEAKKDK